MTRIDINADLGEGCGNDAELMALVTSANIACGWHAGDTKTMRDTARLAIRNGVAIGAHPSFPDRKNFGRVIMQRSPDAIYADVREQIDALATILSQEGVRMHHVKPHGALYTMAASDRGIADAIARAVRDSGEGVALYGLAGSAMIAAARDNGIRAVDEIFADRRYTADGNLVARSRPDALIENGDEAMEQIRALLARGIGKTICVHGDGRHAIAFAARLAAEFLA